jgi:hypothetical protein
MMILSHADNRKARDLTPLLKDLDVRADRVLHYLYVIGDMNKQYALLKHDRGRQDYVDVIRSHNKRMKADLEVIGSKTQSLDDESFLTWINGGGNEAEKRRRQAGVMRLTEKMAALQAQMADARKTYVKEDMNLGEES